MNRTRGLRAFLAAVALLAGIGSLSGCSGSYDAAGAGSSGSTPTATGEIVALTSTQHLVSFNRTTPGSLVTNVAVSGLSTGERLLGVAWRPAEGKLLGLSSAARLFEINALTGVTALRASLVATAGDSNPFAGLSGTAAALSIDASTDRLRVLTSSGQNLVVDPVSGAVLTENTVQRGGVVAGISAAAYSDAFASSALAQLWNINAAADTLERMPAPDTGLLTPASTLGVGAASGSGMVIDARTSAAFAAMTVNGRIALYRIALDASTNVATRIADLGTQDPLLGMAFVEPKGNPLAAQAVGLSTDGRLVKFQPNLPQIVTLVPITGLNSVEVLQAIDFRPADGNLYGLSSAARLLQIDTSTGAVTQQAVLRADASDTSNPYNGLAGASFAINFDPVQDRLRIVSNTGQNLLVNVATGEVLTDAAVHATGQAAVAGGLAYDHRYAGATVATLFVADVAHQMFGTLNAPADGVVSDLGALGLPAGINVNGTGAFNITGGGSGLALLAVQASNGGSLLFSLDLVSGSAKSYPDASAALSAATNRVGGLGGPVLKSLALKL
jgi:hypothetical protein